MTRQQTWSVKAHEKVRAAKGKDFSAKYNTFARKMPSLIQTAGLVQALVFVESRGKEGQRFCEDLARVYANLNRDQLRSKAQEAGLADYVVLARDVCDVAVWFRRFAQIELGDEEAEL